MIHRKRSGRETTGEAEKINKEFNPSPAKEDEEYPIKTSQKESIPQRCKSMPLQTDRDKSEESTFSKCFKVPGHDHEHKKRSSSFPDKEAIIPMHRLSTINGRKMISFEDFYLLLKDTKFGSKLRESEIMQLFRSHDTDGDNYLSAIEFTHLVAKRSKDFAMQTCQRPYPGKHLDELRGFQKLRQFLHLTLDEFDYSVASKVIQLSVMFLIVVSTFSFMLESIDDFRGLQVFSMIEWIVTMVFSLEYVLRLSCCRSPCRFMKNWLNLIDLCSFLPFYIELTRIMSGTAGLRVVRTIRLTRMVRMMKFELFAEYMLIFSNTLSFAKHSFGMLGVLLLFPLVICSCLMFSVEEGHMSHFDSIFDAMYWTIITMTTLGYGDQYPNTVMGKIISCTTVIIGIIYLTFAINIIGSCFDEAYGRYLKRLSKKKKAAIRRIVETEDEKAGNKYRKSLLQTIPSKVIKKVPLKTATSLQAEPISDETPAGFDNIMASLNEMMLALLLSKNGKIPWTQGEKMLFRSFAELQQHLQNYTNYSSKIA